MHHRIWVTLGTALVLGVAGSGTAVGSTASVSEAVGPFAQAWAQVGRTPAARAAKSTAVVAMEQDLPATFNTNFVASNTGWTLNVVSGPVLADVFAVSDKLQYMPSLVSKVTATKQGITYDIRPNAVWNWGGRKVPVTYRDFVYTKNVILDAKNDAFSRAGVNQLGGYTHKGLKQITFKWKTTNCTADAPCGPYADYRDIFTYVYPSFALEGMDFDTMWATCVCGSDGKFVSDGPYYISNYTKGQGVTLKANPLWWGKRPSLKEIDFKLVVDTNSEIQAIRGGEVDIANPQPQTALSSLVGIKGLVYKVVPGLKNEHIELQEGPPGNPRAPLLRAPWFRQAIMLGLDRQGLINALYSQIAPGLKPMNNLVFYPLDTANYRDDFARWSFNPQKAIDLLKAHGCTGGPSKPTPGNTSYFTCAGYPAKLAYSTASDNSRRVTGETVFKANLAAIGIQVTDDLLPTAVLFDDQHLVAGNFDMIEFAFGGVTDPGGNNQFLMCNGSQNFIHYCSTKVTKLLQATSTELDPARRNAEFRAADRLMAQQVPSIPLYDLPEVVTYRSTISGVTDAPTGFTWNIQDWKWMS
ncbi:MAG TPA: ABC transporter substrate-binding protein [Gaiellaceae bacterium]|nr:ABC transporter substrate-binding protein [Gaiellaceae bacterium]HUK97591.1 ABC transporter substrate-binding protein [Gaiellaceae bacterium]